MGPRDRLTLALLVAISVFLMADQKIMTAILPELTAEYGVSRMFLGGVGSAFVLVGVGIGVVFGYLTDRYSRKKLLLITVLVGEIPCLLSGLECCTRSIEAFTLLRVLTGIGVGGVYPITLSLISDYFHEKHRITAVGWISVAWTIGMMAGPTLAGFVTPDHGWRLSFILVAAPGFPLALIFWWVAREPGRGRSEAALQKLFAGGARYTRRIRPADLLELFANRTNRIVFLQGLFGTVPWGILGFWIIDYLQDAGLSKTQGTLVLLLVGIGATVGTLGWAYVGRRVYGIAPRWLPVLISAATFAGIFPFLYVTNLIAVDPLQHRGLVALYAMALIAGLLAAVANANVKAILMNVNRPETRGSVFAVFHLVDNLGQGCGPLLGSLLIGALGYATTMNLAVLCWLPCAVAFLAVSRVIGGDRRRLQCYLEGQAGEMRSNVRVQHDGGPVLLADDPARG